MPGETDTDNPGEELVRQALPTINGNSDHGNGRGNGSGAGKVYKDECTFGFDTPKSKDGIYVSLMTFQVRHEREERNFFRSIDCVI